MTATADSSPRFYGSGFHARSSADFEKASSIEGAQQVDISARPGKGRMITLHDPNGYEIQFLWDQEGRTPPEHGISVCTGGHPPMNGALEKHRKVPAQSHAGLGDYTRMIDSPAMVHKLGHFGYETDNYDSTCAWHTKHFNFRPTDVLYAAANKSLDVATFFRVDIGKGYVDHYCFLITRSEKSGTKVRHSSFEVEDIATQFMGHQWLADRGHELVWGIGRHIHGSQVFDY
ncbi:hypothetical protein LTR53_012102 [Teratosphaeriaceae sp. CCFEE 6253]|nr:hypothetical protein LTR53_012102 [Teratosphaeriaceae sp. CCFEE 6253]